MHGRDQCKHTHMHSARTHSPPTGFQKQIYEAIKAHIFETVAHTNTHTHHNPAKCRALHILSPPSTHWRQMFSVILHLFLQHTHTHTKSLKVLRRTLTHFLIGTKEGFLVQDCKTDPDCWLCESDWEKRNMER